MNRPILTWSLGPKSTRVMVTRGSETLLKARLSPGPSHPRAAQWLMEAVALWEGAKVRAVICADGAASSSARAFWDAVAMDLQCPGGALYRLDLLPHDVPDGRLMHDCVSPLGPFDDFSDMVRVAARAALEGSA